MRGDRFYFLHIKKCAGTSFVALARANCRLYPENLNGNPVYGAAAGEAMKDSFLPFWTWSLEEQEALFTKGDCDFIANERTLTDDFGMIDGVTYVTTLRDPVERFISQYYHEAELGNISHDLPGFINGFIGKLPWTQNFMTWQLTGMRVGKPCDARAVDLAIERLSRFHHVFFKESYSEDVLAMAAHGWEVGHIPVGNRRNDFSKDILTKADLDLVQEFHQTDMAIYDRARALFGSGMQRHV